MMNKDIIMGLHVTSYSKVARDSLFNYIAPVDIP